jgi:2-oxoglutarate ferredoxin oxidoreductase subunit gamma
MIGSPSVKNPDTLIVMNTASALRFTPNLKPKGILFINTSMATGIPVRPDISIISIKATDIAAEIGDTRIANIVMLGAFVAKTRIVNPETVLKMIVTVIPEHRRNILRINKKAFEKGYESVSH